MFNFDQAIAGWRQQMAHGGLSEGEVLDELESHLRDEFESRLRTGLSAPDAFQAAVQRVGEAHALKHEFATSITAADRLKDLIFTLAGIPHQTLATTTMNNTSRFEPAWATYLKATAFLLPAIFFAIVSAIFVVPKLQQICSDAGLPTATAGTFWNLTYSSIQIMLAMSHHGVMLAGGVIVLLLLLEWRFAQWPRYRRAAVGCGAFVLNSFVLLAFFMMFLAAIVAAPALAQLSK